MSHPDSSLSVTDQGDGGQFQLPQCGNLECVNMAIGFDKLKRDLKAAKTEVIDTQKAGEIHVKQLMDYIKGSRTGTTKPTPGSAIPRVPEPYERDTQELQRKLRLAEDANKSLQSKLQLAEAANKDLRSNWQLAEAAKEALRKELQQQIDQLKIQYDGFKDRARYAIDGIKGQKKILGEIIAFYSARSRELMVKVHVLESRMELLESFGGDALLEKVDAEYFRRGLDGSAASMREAFSGMKVDAEFHDYRKKASAASRSSNETDNAKSPVPKIETPATSTTSVLQEEVPPAAKVTSITPKAQWSKNGVQKPLAATSNIGNVSHDITNSSVKSDPPVMPDTTTSALPASPVGGTKSPSLQSAPVASLSMSHEPEISPENSKTSGTSLLQETSDEQTSSSQQDISATNDEQDKKSEGGAAVTEPSPEGKSLSSVEEQPVQSPKMSTSTESETSNTQTTTKSDVVEPGVSSDSVQDLVTDNIADVKTADEGVLEKDTTDPSVEQTEQGMKDVMTEPTNQSGGWQTVQKKELDYKTTIERMRAKLKGHLKVEPPAIPPEADTESEEEDTVSSRLQGNELGKPQSPQVHSSHAAHANVQDNTQQKPGQRGRGQQRSRPKANSHQGRGRGRGRGVHGSANDNIPQVPPHRGNFSSGSKRGSANAQRGNAGTGRGSSTIPPRERIDWSDEVLAEEIERRKVANKFIATVKADDTKNFQEIAEHNQKFAQARGEAGETGPNNANYDFQEEFIKADINNR